MNTMTEEEIEQGFDDIYESQRRIEDEFQKAKQLFKEKGIYKGDFGEFERELFGCYLYLEHIGYVNVELLPSKRYRSRKKRIMRYGFSITDRYFKISDLDNEMKRRERLSKAIFPEGTIRATNGDYSTYLSYHWRFPDCDIEGYVLLPMKDGKYWLFYVRG